MVPRFVVILTIGKRGSWRLSFEAGNASTGRRCVLVSILAVTEVPAVPPLSQPHATNEPKHVESKSNVRVEVIMMHCTRRSRNRTQTWLIFENEAASSLFHRSEATLISRPKSRKTLFTEDLPHTITGKVWHAQDSRDKLLRGRI